MNHEESKSRSMLMALYYFQGAYKKIWFKKHWLFTRRIFYNY